MTLNNADDFGISELQLFFPKENKLFFNKLNFNYQQGEKILIVGANGCGKSTLLQVLAGLVPEHIELAAKWQRRKIPKLLAYCMQDPETQINMPHVDEEIAFVLENQQLPSEQMLGKIKFYCQTVGLKEDNLHRQVSQLSGGDKQKLQLASMLALKSEVLFFDEPTAMLDTQATQNFWQQINQQLAHKTWLVVEHKITEVLPYITRVIVIDTTQQIIADGPAAQIFSQQRSYLDSIGVWHPDSWRDKPMVNQLAEPNTKKPQLLIELRDFSVYLAKRKIVTAKQLTVYAGQWINIIGANGAGKSTLLNGLAELEETSGDLVKINLSSNDICLVFQNPEYQFVTNTVLEELAFSVQFCQLAVAEQQQRIKQFLRQFNLTSLQTRHPFSLSIGEKKRLSIAANLIAQPKLILLDEPTLGLDAQNTFNLLAVLQQFQQAGTSIIMVTHDEQIARRYSSQLWQVKQQQVSQLGIAEFAASDLLPVGMT